MGRRCLLALLLAASACTEPNLIDHEVDAGPNPADFSCDALAVEAAFCDDFDRLPLHDAWTDVEIFPDDSVGSIERSSVDPLSPPRSLRVRTSRKQTADWGGVFVRKTFPELAAKPFRARVSFWFKVDEFDPSTGGEIQPLYFRFGDDTDCEPYLLCQNTNALVWLLHSRATDLTSQFSENIRAGTLWESHGGRVAAIPRVGEWVEVELALEVRAPEGSGNRASLRIGDEFLYDDELEYDLQGGVPRLELGVPLFQAGVATGSWQIHFDNLLVTVELLD